MSFDPFSAAISAAGGVYAQVKTDQRQEDAQQFNAQQAAAQMNFQERMRNTAYQAGMYDMKQAGLNPILAYQKGPASSPTGAAASTSYTEAKDILTPALHSGFQASRVSAEIDNMKQTNENLRSTNDLTKMQTVQTGSQIANINASTQRTLMELDALRKNAELGKQDESFYKGYIGQGSRYLGNLIRELNPMLPKPGNITIQPFKAQ